MKFKEILLESNNTSSVGLLKMEFDFIRGIIEQKKSKADLLLKIMVSPGLNDTVWLPINQKQLNEIEKLLTKRG